MYQEKVRPLVEEGNHGRIVAIDIDSGAYQLGDTPLEASHRVLDQYPDAQIWCVRIGYPAVYRYGRQGLGGTT
jgi:hypothetical protein